MTVAVEPQKPAVSTAFVRQYTRAHYGIDAIDRLARIGFGEETFDFVVVVGIGKGQQEARVVPVKAPAAVQVQALKELLTAGGVGPRTTAHEDTGRRTGVVVLGTIEQLSQAQHEAERHRLGSGEITATAMIDTAKYVPPPDHEVVYVDGAQPIDANVAPAPESPLKAKARAILERRQGKKGKRKKTK